MSRTCINPEELSASQRYEHCWVQYPIWSSWAAHSPPIQGWCALSSLPYLIQLGSPLTSYTAGVRWMRSLSDPAGHPCRCAIIASHAWPEEARLQCAGSDSPLDTNLKFEATNDLPKSWEPFHELKINAMDAISLYRTLLEATMTRHCMPRR